MNITKEQVLREVAGQGTRIACIEADGENKLLLQDTTVARRGVHLSFISDHTIGSGFVELRFDESNQLIKILVEHLN